jgi:glycosyltransferase involved in cell wall biosynthesis
MQVCIIYDGDYPWDVRIEKMTITLVNNGYDVHLICRNLNKKPIYEMFNEIHIHRIPARASNFVNHLSSFPAFFNPLWLAKIRDVIRRFAIDLIVVRDLPLALAAVLIGKRYDLPVIFDMAENYPAMLHDAWKYDDFKLTNLVVRNPTIAKAVERVALKTVTHVITVIEESKARLVRLGVDEARISIVRNTPVIGVQNDEEAGCVGSEGNVCVAPHRIKLIYVGGLEPMRGLDALIGNMPELVEEIPQLRLTIVGGGKWQNGLEAEVNRLGLGPHVTFTGRLPYWEALKRVRQSDAGIIPHRITPHTTCTIPNKLFEYMMNGVPVIATNMAPVRRIIEDTGCGYIYSNVSELAGALNKVADENIRKRLGDNARQATRTQYNWNMDGQSFLRVIELALHKPPLSRLTVESVAK